MTRQQVLDFYFIDARSKLIDIAAFLDRIERSEGDADFRLAAVCKALCELRPDARDNAKRVLLAFSDPSTEPIASAAGKGACGAFNPASSI
jgi:hypothetical protein